MNRLKFHRPIWQVNFPSSSSSSENISRSSCRLNLEMEYRIIIRSFLIGSSKVISRFCKRKKNSKCLFFYFLSYFGSSFYNYIFKQSKEVGFQSQNIIYINLLIYNIFFKAFDELGK